MKGIWTDVKRLADLSRMHLLAISGELSCDLRYAESAMHLASQEKYLGFVTFV